MEFFLYLYIFSGSYYQFDLKLGFVFSGNQVLESEGLLPFSALFLLKSSAPSSKQSQTFRGEFMDSHFNILVFLFVIWLAVYAVVNNAGKAIFSGAMSAIVLVRHHLLECANASFFVDEQIRNTLSLKRPMIGQKVQSLREFSKL